MTQPVLQLEKVQFGWAGRRGFSLSVSSFQVAAGETVLLVGESGSGKSTLLSLICGTVVPDSGRVSVAGSDISQLSSRARDKLRAEKIGVIFQQFNLLPFGNVVDNVLLPLRFAPGRRNRAGDATSAARRLCVALGLPKDVLTEKAHRLSVGQQQRVAVARALIGEPPLIVADEPTSALDANTQEAFLDVLFQQAHACSASVLMVSHDARLADRFDRVVEMDEIVVNERPAA